MKYLPVSLKNLKFLQTVLQRYTIIPEFFRLEMGVFARAVKLDSPGMLQKLQSAILARH
jgi:hypothetical protein